MSQLKVDIITDEEGTGSPEFPNGADITGGNLGIGTNTPTEKLDVIGNIKSNNMFGFNQSWQNVTASRSANVTYTNNTGKPIVVALYFAAGVDIRRDLTVDGLEVKFTATDGTLALVVPNGSTYSTTLTANLVRWIELR